MESFPWEIILAVLGVAVPVVAALWEFVFFGLKRLGYRVQMDTTATDEAHPPGTDGWEQLWPGLHDPSLVLLRVENNGLGNIDSSDYQVLDHDKVGLRVRFPGRRVHRMVVTEPSDESLLPNFGPDSGLSYRDDLIELPRVPLNRGQHYKVLAVLHGDPDTAEPPQRNGGHALRVIGGIKGGVSRGRVRRTTSRSTDLSWRSALLIGFLMLLVVGQFVVWLTEDQTSRRVDCAAEGSALTVVGSTAFRPVLDDAARAYERTCPGTRIELALAGSQEGLALLDRERDQHMLAFSDGPKPDSYAMLVSRPVAFSLFTLVVNPAAEVADLRREDIQRVYGGEVGAWREVGGADTPVVLVSRRSGSGTRAVFEQRVLGGPPLTYNSDDCLTRIPDRPGQVLACEVSDTDAVIDTVADVEGAIGYAEVSAARAAAERGEVRLLDIDGQAATLEAADEGLYPFWETEYAYTYDRPAGTSLALSFLRYLTREVGQDIIRDYGHQPCAELRDAMRCQPVPTEPAEASEASEASGRTDPNDPADPADPSDPSDPADEDTGRGEGATT
ncbi:substrate-binding domain-containing protein [Streptomyces sp. 4N509B]|uniref:substrate-binding domain-containing protein n=1 Tax=Streptomyces sp. 4N509B TaxID=3457413 RepID=UPI003FD3140D